MAYRTRGRLGYYGGLKEQGVALLRGWFDREFLGRLKKAAEACFHAIESGSKGPVAQYRFTPFSHSVVISALCDFGAGPREQLVPPLTPCFEGDDLVCDLDQSWVRKRFAPANAPPHYQPNSWHQDGGLGINYDGPLNAMTQMLTCWIPLCDCGRDAPGLEFVRQRLYKLLHYTELDDANLRQRFAAEDFWAPELEPGDGLLFLPDVLHRTYVSPEMRRDRLSVEYRFFPAGNREPSTITMNI